MLEVIKKNWSGFLLSIIFAEAIGIVSSMLSGNVEGKYNAYIQPTFSPPDWIFGLVWPILYALMGFAVYLFYLTAVDSNIRKRGIMLYCVQLFLNFIWSIVFFRFDMIAMALLILLLMLVTVAYMIAVFKKQNKLAGNLVIPYLLWLLFATYLNLGIFILN